MSMDLKSAPMSQEPTIIMDRGLEMESKEERKLLTNGGREKGERNRTIARIEAIDTEGEHEDVVEKVVDNAEDHPFGAEEHIDQRISDETGVGEYAHIYRTKKPTSVLDEKF